MVDEFLVIQQLRLACVPEAISIPLAASPIRSFSAGVPPTDPRNIADPLHRGKLPRRTNVGFGGMSVAGRPLLCLTGTPLRFAWGHPGPNWPAGAVIKVRSRRVDLLPRS